MKVICTCEEDHSGTQEGTVIRVTQICRDGSGRQPIYFFGSDREMHYVERFEPVIKKKVE